MNPTMIRLGMLIPLAALALGACGDDMPPTAVDSARQSLQDTPPGDYGDVVDCDVHRCAECGHTEAPACCFEGCRVIDCSVLKCIECGNKDGLGCCAFEDCVIKNKNVPNTDPGQDTDGDGTKDATDLCPFDAEDDEDRDGICGDVDRCPGTTLPEGVPTAHLGHNRFADTDGDGVFDTPSYNGNAKTRVYTLADTGGCTCEQIIASAGLGTGHSRFGCSAGAMEDWVR
jgi:hypothetical protein